MFPLILFIMIVVFNFIILITFICLDRSLDRMDSTNIVAGEYHVNLDPLEIQVEKSYIEEAGDKIYIN